MLNHSTNDMFSVKATYPVPISSKLVYRNRGSDDRTGVLGNNFRSLISNLFPVPLWASDGS